MNLALLFVSVALIQAPLTPQLPEANLRRYELHAVTVLCQAGRPIVAMQYAVEREGEEVPIARSIICVPKQGNFGLHILCSVDLKQCGYEALPSSAAETLHFIRRSLGLHRP